MNRSKHNLIYSLNSRNWHMRASSAIGYLPLVVSVLTGENTSFFDDDDTSSEKKKARAESFMKANAISATPYEVPDMYYYDFPPFKIGSIGVIPIVGAIMQYDYCGGAGTKTISSWYAQMLQDPEITGIFELANSGGGDVLGTSELANFKLIVRQSKPIVTLTEGLCCSAMEYIAAASDYIIATSKSIIAGSIGVMTTYVNFKKYYKKMGVTVEEIYSKDSPLKNHAHRLAADGDYSAYSEGLLFQLDKSFMDFMKENRPQISEEALKGAEYTAELAIENGVIDAIGTIDDAIAKINQLAISKQSNTTNMKQFFQSLGAKLGVSLAVKADNTEHTEQEIAEGVANAIFEKINGFSQSLEGFKTQKSEDDKKLSSLESKLSEATKANTDLKEELASLKSKVPGANATTPEQDKEDKAPESSQKWTPIV